RSLMPSNLRSNTQSGPVNRSCVSVAAIGSSQSGISVKGVAGTGSSIPVDWEVNKMKWILSAARALVPVPALMALVGCCTYTAVPDGTPMSASGGAIPVNVTTSQTSCTWTYQSNAPWITVGPDPDSTGQTGTGNGRVLVTAASNTGTSRRTDTATVAGKTVTVDQAGTGGSGCTFQVSPTELTFTGGAAGTGQFTITASAQNCGW